MRGRVRLRDLPCLRRPGLGRADRQAEPMEEDMLDFAFEVQPNSRLSCQIKVRPVLDGLTVRTPARQG